MSHSSRHTQLKKNQSYQAEVVDLTYEAMGVVKIENYPIFVEGALPGEVIQFKLVKLNKNYGYGRLEYVHQASPHREEVEEEMYAKTGLMPLQHMSYDLQLQFKRDQVINALQRTAGLTDIEVGPTIGMEDPYAYRNKAQVPVQQVDGDLQIGAFRQRSHDLVPLEDFKIQDPRIDRALVTVRDILRHYDIATYDEETQSGLIRHIIVRRGHYSGQIMVILVTNGWTLPHNQDIVQDLRQHIQGLVSVIQNINDRNTNVILGDESRVLFGEDAYRDSLLALDFDISHRSFYQVNTLQTEKLYQVAIDWANLKGDEVVVDAYCGIGTITLALARHAKQVYGIEIVEDAVKNAQSNAQLNAMTNAEFVCGPAEELLPQWAASGFYADVLVVDPPRKGLDSAFMDAALQLDPDRIIYISCNPATLARDVKYLMAGGYQPIKVQPVDMFPQTKHIECCCQLVRQQTH